MRWLCDEMLGRLARLLRAAGEDVHVCEPGTDDAALLETAAREGRRLVTRDRRLADAAGAAGILISADPVLEQALELADAAPVDWRRDRFTRCLMDNTPLQAASAAEIAALPPTAARQEGPFRACPRCGRVYWPGSHVRRLAERLDRLAAASPNP